VKWPVTTHTNTHTHTHTYRFLSRCEEVENCTSQLVEPHNLPQPRNTTLLHALSLATTQILEHTPTQCLPTRLHTDLYANNGARIGRLNIHLRGPSCKEVGNWTLQLPTTSQHHVLARIWPRNYSNVNAHTHTDRQTHTQTDTGSFTFSWQCPGSSVAVDMVDNDQVQSDSLQPAAAYHTSLFLMHQHCKQDSIRLWHVNIIVTDRATQQHCLCSVRR